VMGVRIEFDWFLITEDHVKDGDCNSGSSFPIDRNRCVAAVDGSTEPAHATTNHSTHHRNNIARNSHAQSKQRGQIFGRLLIKG